jgi:nucleoprotein TPR
MITLTSDSSCGLKNFGRSALKVAELDLVNARSHVQQFQEISQANEEALSSLNATYDEFRSSTESQIAKHEVRFMSFSLKLSTDNKL